MKFVKILTFSGSFKMNCKWHSGAFEAFAGSLGFLKRRYHGFLKSWKLICFAIFEYSLFYLYIFDESLYKPFRQNYGIDSGLAAAGSLNDKFVFLIENEVLSKVMNSFFDLHQIGAIERPCGHYTFNPICSRRISKSQKGATLSFEGVKMISAAWALAQG